MLSQSWTNVHLGTTLSLQRRLEPRYFIHSTIMGSVVEKRPVSLHIWVQKKPGMSQEEFRDYWSKVHGNIFLEMDVVKKHCLRYEQVSSAAALVVVCRHQNFSYAKQKANRVLFDSGKMIQRSAKPPRMPSAWSTLIGMGSLS